VNKEGVNTQKSDNSYITIIRTSSTETGEQFHTQRCASKRKFTTTTLLQQRMPPLCPRNYSRQNDVTVTSCIPIIRATICVCRVVLYCTIFVVCYTVLLRYVQVTLCYINLVVQAKS